jgi:nucleoside-diphosphate-sugar epimerase
MNVLLISGTGFIGARVVQQLIQDEHHVTVFHRGQTESSLPLNVNHILGDRQKLIDFVGEFQHLAPDVVLDMLPYTEQDAVELMQTFRRLTKRIVAISSMDVYQAYGCFRRSETCDLASIPFDETAPLRQKFYPYRAYAKSPDDLLYNYDKILVERIVMNQERLPSTILRLPKVYGDGDGQRYLSEYVKRIEDQRNTIVMETGKAQWRWTRGYVENVALAIALAIT